MFLKKKHGDPKLNYASDFFSKQELQWYFGWYLVIRNEQLAWVFAGLYQGIGVSSMAELPTTVGHQMTNKHLRGGIV